MFGSDYPFITPQRWMKDFDALDSFKPEVREKLLWRNAQKLFDLATTRGATRAALAALAQQPHVQPPRVEGLW